MTVRLWRTLTQDERKKLSVKGMVYFPEIFGNSPKKYDRFTLWLVTTQRVVSTSMRDSFTAGGKVKIVTKYGIFEDLPQIYGRVKLLKEDIKTELENADGLMLAEYGGITGHRHADRLHDGSRILGIYWGMKWEKY